MTMTIAEELKDQDIELENERTPPNQSPPRKKWWRWVVLMAILLFGAYWAMRSLAQNQQRSENRSAAKSGPPSVPVIAEVAKKGDIPIYLNGAFSSSRLGPFNLYQKASFFPAGRSEASIAVSPDGEKFVVITPIEDTSSLPITVFFHWPSLLKH